MTEAWKRRIFGLVAVALALGALAFVSSGSLGDNLVYYWSPTELRAQSNPQGLLVRLGGLVEPGSIDWDRDAMRLDFRISDGENIVAVHSEGNPPQMFREGIGVVVEGRLGTDDIFRTDKIMVKHSNEYQAPEEGEHNVEAMYGTLEGS